MGKFCTDRKQRHQNLTGTWKTSFCFSTLKFKSDINQCLEKKLQYSVWCLWLIFSILIPSLPFVRPKKKFQVLLSFSSFFFFFFLILMHDLYTETNQTHHGLMLSWSKSCKGHWGFFAGFFWSRVTTAHTIFGQHTFSNSTFVFSSCWYFSIILNTGNGSKCLGSLLKVELASVPQVIPLEGFPTSQEHPIKNSKTTQRHQFPHKPIIRWFVPVKLWRKKTRCSKHSAD